MKNSYIQRIEQAKRAAYNEGIFKGASFVLNVATIALNRLYGFGADRIERLETEINRIIETEFKHNDEVEVINMQKAIQQIRGKRG